MESLPVFAVQVWTASRTSSIASWNLLGSSVTRSIMAGSATTFPSCQGSLCYGSRPGVVEVDLRGCVYFSFIDTFGKRNFYDVRFSGIASTARKISSVFFVFLFLFSKDFSFFFLWLLLMYFQLLLFFFFFVGFFISQLRFYSFS